MIQEIWHGDCLELMKNIPDNLVDMILCDLPYGTTQAKWDNIIPLDRLWQSYFRVIKENGAIVLNGNQPFTSILVASQLKYFKYEWIWRKNSGSGFSNANRQPLRYHENILVFYKKQPIYNKQPTQRLTEASKKATLKPIKGNSRQSYLHGKSNKVEVLYDSNNKNPETILEFNSVPNAGGKKLHPTQKPVQLLEYLIKTYTNKNDLVLDNCAGSGSTLVAAKNLNRQFIGIEKEKEYYDICLNRLLK